MNRRSRSTSLAIATVTTISLVASGGVPSIARGGRQIAAPTVDRQFAVPDGTVPVQPAPDPLRDNDYRVADAAWPAPDAADVVLSTPDTLVPAGTLPIRVAGVARTAGGRAAESVRLEVLGQDATRRLGMTGMLFRLRPATGGKTAGGRVALEIDYSAFRAAAGAEFGPRLTVIRLPACAVPDAACATTSPANTTSPAAAGAAERIPTRNDVRASVLNVEVAAPADEMGSLFAVTAAASGSTGSFAATTLAPSSSWQVGLQSGEFTWNYPFSTPPMPGPEPELGLGYASGGVDGRMASSNNQPSWVGEGFDLSSGYIERAYRPCNKDSGGNAGNYDQCWVSHNAAAVFDGMAGEMVRDDATGTWRAQDDAGWKVELLTGAVNGDNDGEYWRLTSPEGTQFYFGLGRLPGWSSGRQETQSTWTAPVFGNHAGEPCRTGTPSTSWCQQAYRWNLDYVVDRYGDVASYFYQQESNYYGRWNGSPYFGQTTPYVRGGYLTRIDYGQRDGAVYTTNPGARMVFTVADRCRTTGSACDPASSGNWKNWPDVPWDQRCTSSCTYYWEPTFWTTKRLSKVVTQVWSGTALSDVSSWTLRQSYPDPYPGSDPWTETNDASKSLWLDGIVHTGLVGGTASLPELTFDRVSLPNRHNSSADFPALYKFRVSAVNTETGGRIEASYSSPQCGGEPYIIPDQNVSRCYPRGDLAGRLDPDVFYKYVVTSVREVDRVGGAPTVVNNYEYVGGAAWHYDDADATPAADRDWNQWRGYGKVRVRTGDPAGVQTLTEHLFLRGMDNDLVFGGRRNVWVSDSQGGTIEDHARLRGFARETVVHNGSSGAVVSGTLMDPWLAGPIASRARAGLDPVQAFQIDVARVRERTPLAGGGVRTTEERRTFDSLVRMVQVDDLADTATAADDSCTRLSYATSPGRWLNTLPARVEQVSVGCATTPARPADVISDERMYYDGQGAVGTAAATGTITREEDLVGWTAGAGVYLTSARTTYDGHGRETEASDFSGDRMTTSYTPASGGPVTRVSNTNALGHVDFTDVAVAWGEPAVETDENGRRTELAYDPLGRLTAVWFPERPRSSGATPNLQFEYLVRTNGPSVVTAKKLQASGSYAMSLVLYDGLLRERQTQDPAPGGGRVVTDTFYDSHGWQTKANAGYHNASAPATNLVAVADSAVPAQTLTLYDGAGRETADILRSSGAERWRTTTVHGGDFITRDPPDGAPASSLHFDAEGQLLELRQFRGGAPTGTFDATRYAYTTSGSLSTVTDPVGNLWRYHYDQRGRMVRADDPDTGTSVLAYDDEDRVVATTDARGQTLAYTHDALDRRTAVFAGSTGGTRLVEWTYDTLAKGLMTSSIRYAGGQAYTTSVLGYDAEDRPTGSRVTIPPVEGALAGTYDTSFTYNAADQVATTTMPAAGGLPQETLQYGYDGLGLPTTMTGLATYLAGATYTPLGQAAQFTLGTTGSQLWQTFSYEASTGRLHRMRTDRQASTQPAVSDLNFTYDAGGNLVRLADTAVGQPVDTQCFRHDHQRRLTQAWTPGSGDCAAAPATAGLGGPAPYWHTYGYDVVGNRTSEVRHGGAGDITRTYAYSAPGSPQPHAVRSVTRSGAGSGTETFGYDVDGNTTARPGVAQQQALTWDIESHLGSVTESGATTSYLYDAAGERLLRRDPTGTTLYFGTTELRRDNATGVVTGTRYYVHDGGTVAVRTGGRLQWLFGDQHGTGTASVDASTLAVTYRRHLPFGEQRGSPPAAWPGERGFAGGTVDATGLIHLGAREYDPKAGRFVSVDPVLDHTDPQGMQRYAYANNSPLTYSDPDGLAPSKCSWWDLICKAKEKAAELTEKARKAWEAAKAIARAIAERAKQLAKAAWEKVKEVAKKVAKVVKKVVNAVKKVVKKAVEKVKKAFKKVADKVKQVVKRVAQKVKKKVKEVIEKVKKKVREKLGIPDKNRKTKEKPPVPAEVYAVGGSPVNKNTPKPGPNDYQVDDDGMVVPQGGDNPAGKSSYISLETLSKQVKGQVWKTSTANLPDGIAMVRDGPEAGGTQPVGHVTIYPTKRMTVEDFISKIQGLPWEHVTNVKKKTG